MKKPLKSRSIEKRLIGYGTMSMAIAAAIAPNAGAGVVYWATDVTTPTGGGIYFNVITGASSNVSSNSLAPGATTGEFALENEISTPSFFKAFVIGSSNNKFAVAGAASNPGSANPYPTSAARLAINTKIDAGLTFNNPGKVYSAALSSFVPNNVFTSLASNFGAVGQWNALGSDFLGLSFQDGSQTDYGWAEITVNPDYTVTLDAVAYDDSGNAILAGDVPASSSTPEPNSLLLMALGATGLAAYRRKLAAKRSKVPVGQ